MSIMKRNDILTDSEISMRYHEAREVFFRKITSSIMVAYFLIIEAVLITNVAYGSVPYIVLFPLGAFVIIGILAFIEADNKATEHKELRIRFTELTGEVLSIPKHNVKQLEAWVQELYHLFSQEPPTYAALEAHCYNQVSQALGCKEKDGYYVKIRWYHMWFRNVFHFRVTRFPAEVNK